MTEPKYIDKILSSAKLLTDSEVQEILEYVKTTHITKSNYKEHHLKTQKFLDSNQSSFFDNMQTTRKLLDELARERARVRSLDYHNILKPVMDLEDKAFWAVELAAFQAYANNLIYRAIVRQYWTSLDEGYSVGFPKKVKEEMSQDGGKALAHALRVLRSSGIDVEATIKEKTRELNEEDAKVSLLDKEFEEKTKTSNALRLRKAIHEFYLNKQDWPGRAEVRTLLPNTGKDVVEDALAFLVKQGQIIMQKQGNKNKAVLADVK